MTLEARIVTLVDREHAQGAPTSSGTAANGSPVSSGVYFARIEHAGAARSKKMVLLKDMEVAAVKVD
jgi:hypothetical protein